jgi:hypothetical protein
MDPADTAWMSEPGQRAGGDRDRRSTTAAPSGLFPSGPRRPTFREPHPIQLGALFAGAAIAAAWLFAFGLLASSATSFIWLTFGASVVAWVVAAVLTVIGDRGAAVGVALATALGMAIATAVLIERWATSGWPLW